MTDPSGRSPSTDFSALEPWGWSKLWQTRLQDALEELKTLGKSGSGLAGTLAPARVIFHSHEHYRIETLHGERRARLSGTLRHEGLHLPAVGDWVLVKGDDDGELLIRGVLERTTQLSRKVAGERTEEQVVAANVDTVFLVMGLDGDFNTNRLGRFLVMSRESGADAIVILTKADLVEDPDELKWQASEAAPGVPVHVVTALHGRGLEPIRAFLEPGKTVSLIGSSGAGKSTLINELCGREVMRTGGVRESDDRGRHTTTHRELVSLPGGGVLIDNPGVREIQLWTDGSESLTDSFADIEELATECRFRDCQHESEPGCAIKAALEAGTLDEKRFSNYLGLGRELRFLELRQDERTRRQAERKLGASYKSALAAKKNRR